MITGGWDYITAAYLATWIVLGVYGLSLWLRFRGVVKREKELS